MQIKTKMKYHLIPVRIAIINKSINNKYWWDCALMLGLQTDVATMENGMKGYQKLKIELPGDLSFPLLGIYPNKTIILI